MCILMYDILQLLTVEQYDTKPNMSKFLKTYVQSIRICISNGKVDLWPKIHYDISKVIVRFKDNQTLIKDSDNVYLMKNFNDIEFNDKEKELLLNFFKLLEQFKFIRNGNTDVKVFSTDVEKTNAQLEIEQNCIKEKWCTFKDYTPQISVNLM